MLLWEIFLENKLIGKPLFLRCYLVKQWNCILLSSGLRSYKDVIFELDAQIVDVFTSSYVAYVAYSKFECLVRVCKDLFLFLSNNSHVEFSTSI